MNKTFQWNGEKFYFSALEAETTRKFIPEATKTAKALEDYEKDVVGVGNLLSADDIIAECKIIDAFLDTIYETNQFKGILPILHNRHNRRSAG